MACSDDPWIVGFVGVGLPTMRRCGKGFPSVLWLSFGGTVVAAAAVAWVEATIR